MSIIIGRIDNKFGSNSGHKFPNGFPVYAEQEELKFDTPNMNDFLSGTIYLIGDSGNHCKYEDAYYSLYIVHLVSHRKKRYLYRLERDLGMDILLHRPKVIGDLANSNDDKLLEANLNRTISALDNPAKVLTINFGNVDFDGKKGFTFKLSRKDLPQVVLSKDNFNTFVSSAKGAFIKSGPYINETLYSISEGGTNTLKYGSNPATFIVGYLEPSITRSGGKHILREKVNEFVESIEKNPNLKVAKVNAQNFAGTQLYNSYCITYKDVGISTSEEALRLREIDLSQLTDIVAINVHNMKEKEPDTPIYEGNKSGLFEVVENRTYKEPFLAKIRRKAYLPINSSDPTSTIVPTIPNVDTIYKPWKFKDSDTNGDKVKDPQVVNGSYGGRKGTFNLWFIDNLNFLTVKYDPWDFYYRYSDVHLASSTIIGVFSLLMGTASTAAKFNGNNRIYYFNKNSYFGWPIPMVYKQSPFTELKEPIVPFGFLIYGLQRRYREGKRYEYIGVEKKSDVTYYSGIKNTLFSKYDAKDEWGSEIDQKLEAIQPSITFTKFYLDNYYFTGLCFFPNGSIVRLGSIGGLVPILEGNPGGTHVHMGLPAGAGGPAGLIVNDLLNKDIHDINRRGKKLNPFNDKRYPKHREDVDRNLTTVLNLSKVDLPKGVTFEKGDYLFTDQDYEIVEYPYSNYEQRLRDIAGTAKGGASDFLMDSISLIPGSFMVEDMMEVKGGKLFASEPDQKMVVLCTTEKGGIEIRTLQTFDRVLSISSSANEIVEGIEGSKTRNTRFTLMKKMSENIIDDKFKEFTDEHKEKIIHAFYKLNGYKTVIKGKVAHWTGFNEEDFAEDSDLQQLFDLVGTDWYAFFAKGKISLISKKISLFEVKVSQSAQLLHSENKNLELSLIEKINQKVRFQFFSIPYYLNGKSSFSEKDKIRLFVESLKPTALQTQFEEYFIKLETEFDTVYYENVSLAKKQTPSLSPADTVQLERLSLDLNRAQYAYQVDVDKHKLATDRFNESIRRAETDLYHQRLRSWLQLGGGVAAGAYGFGVKGKHRKGQHTVTTLKRGTEGIDDAMEEERFFVGPEGHSSTVYRKPQVAVPTYTKEIKHVPGKAPNIVAGAIAGAVKMITGSIMDHAFTFPEQARRIGFEKQAGAADLALQSLEIDTAFMEAQINNQHALNQITNRYTNPMINEREIIESFMDKDEGHGKKLKPAHLICFVPSEEQLVALRSFKEEFGVMCDIPDVEINFYEGMKPDVIRYRNLDDKAIAGLPNEGMRVFLHGHLLAGIKVVQTTFETYDLLTAGDYQEKIFRLNSDLLEKANEIGDKDKQITLLNTQMEEKQKQCAQEASELQKRITETENQVNQINKQLRDKVAELNKLREQCEAEKAKSDEIAKQLSDANIKVADLEKIKAQCEEDKKACADLSRQLSAVREEVTKLNQNLEEKINALAALNVDYQAKVRELDVCKTDKETSDAALRKQIESLKQESETRKERVEELTQQLNDERRKYLDERDKLNALSKTSADEKAKLQELIKQINEQIERISKELESYKKTKAPVLATPEDCAAVKEIMSEGKLPVVVDRGDGGNAFLDLVFALAQSRKIANEKYNRSKGGGGFADAVEMKKFEDAVNEVLNLDVVAEAGAIINHKAWPKYQEFISGEEEESEEEELAMETDAEAALRERKRIDFEALAKDWDDLTDIGVSNMKDEPARDEDVDRIIQRINNLKDYEGPMRFYGLRALLDEANYEAYLAFKAVHQKIGTDLELTDYFRTVYPIPIIDKYIALFGDPNLPVIRKVYLDEVDCSKPTEMIQVLKDYKKEIDLKNKFITAVGPAPKPATPAKPKPSKPKGTRKFARSIEEAKYNGVLLDSIELHWPYANPLFAFEDAKVKNNMRNRDYKGTFDGKSYTFRTKPKISLGLQFGDYPYYCNLNLIGRGNKRYKLVGFGGVTNKWDKGGNYMIAEDLKRVDMKAKFDYLISVIDRIGIPETFVLGLKDGTISLVLSQTFPGIVDFQADSDPDASAEDVAKRLHESIKKATYPVKLGNDNLYWPEDKIADLGRYIFIFHYLYVHPEVYGPIAACSGYRVGGFETSKLHPSKVTLTNEELLSRINSITADLLGKTEFEFELGWLFNFHKQRLYIDGDIPVPESVPKNEDNAVFLSFFKGIYGHVSGKKKYLHPYDGGANHIYYLFHRLSQA